VKPSENTPRHRRTSTPPPCLPIRRIYQRMVPPEEERLWSITGWGSNYVRAFLITFVHEGSGSPFKDLIARSPPEEFFFPRDFENGASFFFPLFQSRKGASLPIITLFFPSPRALINSSPGKKSFLAVSPALGWRSSWHFRCRFFPYPPLIELAISLGDCVPLSFSFPPHRSPFLGVNPTFIFF